jgi:hypothetical protein
VRRPKVIPGSFPERPLILLDACCLINLFATERIEEILTNLPYRFATSRFVATKEVLSIARSTEVEGPLEREIIEPHRLEDLENLSLFDLTSQEEMADFVRFAADLDDGEASVCALAVSYKGRVATDDRKTLRLLSRAVPEVVTIQTPALLYEWAHLCKIPEVTVGEVLRSVRHRARFYPPRDARHFEWWASFFI